MRLFRWLSAGPISAGYDLRRLGWRLLEDRARSGLSPDCPLLVQPRKLAFARWLELAGAQPAARRWMLMLDVDDPQERARLLRFGFGDALGVPSSVYEVEARTLRLIEQAGALPRQRHVGPLRLDLFAREAFVGTRGAGLHPREFALLWRLSETPGEAVGVPELLGDVWRLAFRPETNSLAVHVSRLRAKLRLAGADGLIETLPGGAYRLVRGPSAGMPGAAAAGGGSSDFALDAYVRLGKERSGDRMQPGPAPDEEDSDHAT